MTASIPSSLLSIKWDTAQPLITLAETASQHPTYVQPLQAQPPSPTPLPPPSPATTAPPIHYIIRCTPAPPVLPPPGSQGLPPPTHPVVSHVPVPHDLDPALFAWKTLCRQTIGRYHFLEPPGFEDGPEFAVKVSGGCYYR